MKRPRKPAVNTPKKCPYGSMYDRNDEIMLDIPAFATVDHMNRCI